MKSDTHVTPVICYIIICLSGIGYGRVVLKRGNIRRLHRQYRRKIPPPSVFNPLNASVALILTGFYMRATMALNGLK